MAPIMKTASMKPEVALLDNDELNGVDNEADDWQVFFSNRQNLAFLAFFVYFFGTFAIIGNFWENFRCGIAR